MVSVTVTIKYKITEKNYKSDSFQEFLANIRNGEMRKEMDEDKFFEKIKISYTVEEHDLIHEFS
jgi:hypothetical protein